jgi:hypothetical protein
MYFCNFTVAAFFSKFGSIKEYPVFQTHKIAVFYPFDEEVNELRKPYDKFFLELQSESVFRYDLICVIVLQMINTIKKARYENRGLRN